MKLICLILINLYQQFISPRKGFCCAHHSLHQSGSCSHAIKALIQEKGVLKALPDIKQRFIHCRQAFERLNNPKYPLPNADLSCDLPCDVSFGDCGMFGANTTSSSRHCLACELLSVFSKKTQQYLTIGLLLSILIGSYWFYGRGVGNIYIQDTGAQQSIFKRLVQRDNPKLRLLLEHKGKKYYSNIITIDSVNTEYKFTFSTSPTDSQLDYLKILDARVNIANDLVIVGQTLETFEKPKKSAIGGRFSYRITRRWHLF